MGMTAGDPKLRALYYPFSRSLSETTLKRAVLIYDEVIFVDPTSQRVRDGLFDLSQQAQHMPQEAAELLAAEWQAVRERYQSLHDASLVRFVDPSLVVTDGAKAEAVAAALCADLADPGLTELFGAKFPRLWSSLRTRIPEPAFRHLSHQIASRVLAMTSLIDRSGSDPVAYYLDGHPHSTPLHKRWQSYDDGGEYAVLLPYLAGSSIAVSTALALAASEEAVPLTDSSEHFLLLSRRMERAAAALAGVADIPGLKPPGMRDSLQKFSLVQHRVIDSVLSHADLEALSLDDVLLYREKTYSERQQFRRFLNELVRAARGQVWSPDLEREVAQAINAAKEELSSHARNLRNTYRALFKRTLAGLAVSAAPAILASVFPEVSSLAAFLFGAGSLTGLLNEPIRELIQVWSEDVQDRNGLSYLMDLPRASLSSPDN